MNLGFDMMDENINLNVVADSISVFYHREQVPLEIGELNFVCLPPIPVLVLY